MGTAVTAAEIVTERWEWTSQRERAAFAVATHKTLADAAKAANVSDRSLYRWLDVPEFEARVKEHTDRIVRRARIKLAAKAEDAADMMIDLMHFGTNRHGVRLAAAKDILDRVGLKAPEKIQVDATHRIEDARERLEQKLSRIIDVTPAHPAAGEPE